MEELKLYLTPKFYSAVTIHSDTNPPEVVVHLNKIKINELPTLISKIISYEFQGLLRKKFNISSKFNIVIKHE